MTDPISLWNIEGNTLDTVLEESLQPINESQVLIWAIQICEVLTYLHSQTPRPIIFRDLKLSNIMLSKEGMIKLIDFGIAREFNPRKDTDTIRMGSVGYAPMEQYAKGGQTDVRTDVYALGVCLHSLLTKNDPATTPFSFQPIHQFNPGVSQGLNDLIMRAMEIKPESRFQTVQEMYIKLKEELPLPRIRLTPDFIDLGEITPGEKRNVTVIITNSRKGLLSGKLKFLPSEGIKLNLTDFENNYQEVRVDIDTERFEPGDYKETLTFISNGGEADITISFRIIPFKTIIDTDVSFIDFGTLKYAEETSQEITVYNTGGGNLSGRITSPQGWLTFSPSIINTNEEKIKITVDQEKLSEGSTHSGVINIESNGGNIIINTILFRPLLKIIHSEINLGKISGKDPENILLKINSTGKGFLKGRIDCKEPWVRLSSNSLEGNKNYINITVDPASLKKGRKNKAFIEITSNGGNFSIPLIVEPYSLLKIVTKYCFIFFLTLLLIMSNYFRYIMEQKYKFEFMSRLSNLSSTIVYSTEMDASSKIYTIKPDGTMKNFIARGYFPRWSPDGKKLLFSGSERKIFFMDMRTEKYKYLTTGNNPVWFPDGEKITFEKDGDIIYTLNLANNKLEPLIYGQCPSWNPSGDKLVYVDNTAIKVLANSMPDVVDNGLKPLWSPDGKHIVYKLDRKTLAIINPDRISLKKTFEGEEPAWSFKGDRLAFRKEGMIYILDLLRNEEKKIIEGREPSWSPDDKYLAFSSPDGIYVIELSSLMTYQISSEGYLPLWSPYL